MNTMSDSEKLDAILVAMNSITERLGNIEIKLDDLGERMVKIEDRVDGIDEKMNEFEEKNDNCITALETKVSVQDHQQLILKVEQYMDDVRRRNLMSELYDKRLNLLIYGLEESAWETKEKTKIVFNQFLTDGLAIDPSEIHLVDVHRLPQHPLIIRGKHITRPIIIKLPDVFEKTKIMRSLSNLKEFNQNRHERLKTNIGNVFISDHLPKEFQIHKKKLLRKFKEARSEQKKTFWKAVDGEYCLFIDNVKHSPSE